MTSFKQLHLRHPTRYEQPAVVSHDAHALPTGIKQTLHTFQQELELVINPCLYLP